MKNMTVEEVSSLISLQARAWDLAYSTVKSLYEAIPQSMPFTLEDFEAARLEVDETDIVVTYIFYPGDEKELFRLPLSILTEEGYNEFIQKEKEKGYDSRPDTEAHIEKVCEYLETVAYQLERRGMLHDASKLLPPEKECFDEITPLLKHTTYGSEEYKSILRRMKPAIEHHQKNNRHHPEYFDNGINGMTLIDLIEMVCDWKAASERHADGDVRKSVEINKERFNMSDQLAEIINNTIEDLFFSERNES